MERVKVRDTELVLVPYCSPPIGMKRIQELVRPEIVGVHPLMADIPFERTYKGGWDPNLEPPDNYIPFPRACTYVGKFLDKVLSLLPDLPPHWRHFGEYFKLLSGISEFGHDERLFFLSRRAISRCIDFFMNDESMFSSSRKHYVRMGDKFSSPMFAPMLDFISVLVRSTPLDHDIEEDSEDMAPTQLDMSGELDLACLKMVTSRTFLYKALADGGNYPAVQTLFVHLSWLNEARSSELIQMICEALEEDCQEDDLQPHLDLLAMLIAVPDDLREVRIEKLIPMFVHVITELVPYPEMFKRSVEFLCDLVAHRPEVRALLIHYLCPGPRRRDNTRWLESWMIKVEHEGCRMAAYNLACVLAFPSAFLRRTVPPSLPPGILLEETGQQITSERVEHEPDALLEGDELTASIFELLLVAVPFYTPLAHPVEPSRTTSVATRLVFLFRAVMFVVKSAAGRWCLDRFIRSLPDFAAVLLGLNEYRADMDCNRAELYKLLLVAIHRSKTDVLEHLTTDPRWIEALIQNPLGSVQGKVQKANLNYNRIHLPSFFRLIKECCAYSAQFAEAYFSCPHGSFALTNIICMHNKYTDSALLLLETFDIALEWEKQGRVNNLNKIRQTYVDSLLRRRQLFSAPDHSIPFLEKLIFNSSEANDLADEITLLIEGGNLEILVTSARAVNDVSKMIEPARQSAIRILDHMFESVKLVEKKMPDMHMESKVRKAMQHTECTGLVLYLMKCLVSPQLPSLLRQHYLGVLMNLCKCDDEALLNCMSEVLRIYNSADLEAVEDTVAARSARNSSKRPPVQSQTVGKRSSRGKSKGELARKGAPATVVGGHFLNFFFVRGVQRANSIISLCQV